MKREVRAAHVAPCMSSDNPCGRAWTERQAETGACEKGYCYIPASKKASQGAANQPVSTDDLAGFIHEHGNGWSAVLEGDVLLMEVR